jgi:hypothetical protein
MQGKSRHGNPARRITMHKSFIIRLPETEFMKPIPIHISRIGAVMALTAAGVLSASTIACAQTYQIDPSRSLFLSRRVAAWTPWPGYWPRKCEHLSTKV